MIDKYSVSALLDSTPAPAVQKPAELPVETAAHPNGSADPQLPGPATEPPQIAATGDGPLAISALHLCRKVLGFGAFEPLERPLVRSGQRALIYCELSGVRYELQDDTYQSRIASRIELRSAGDNRLCWEHDLGSDHDACRHRRRDYYVNYLVEFPALLTPGPYRLKLLQTDLIANQSAASEIPIEITTEASTREDGPH